MGPLPLAKPGFPGYTFDVMQNRRRWDAERKGWVLIAFLALAGHPAEGADVASVPVVPEITAPVSVDAAHAGALTVIPFAPALSGGNLTAIQAPSVIAQPALTAQAVAPLAAAARAAALSLPAPAAALALPTPAAALAQPAAAPALSHVPAASVDGKSLPQAAAVPEKASNLAALQERVTAVNKPGASAELEIPQLYQGKDAGAGAVAELSPSAGGSGTMGKTNMPTLKDAVALATKAHLGQKDKAGAVYINHPLRVMSRMSTDEEKMAAVLHDVVEDTSITLQDLSVAGYPKAVVDAVDALSRRKGETYEQFIERLMPNALARKVKIADLEDNMDLGRIPNPQPKDFERVAKYRRVWQELTELESRESSPIDFKYYAIMVDGKARGLFAFNRGRNRFDALTWNHHTKQWEHNAGTVGRYFFSDLDAEEVSRAKAEEIARGFGATVPSESDLMKITDQFAAKGRSDKK